MTNWIMFGMRFHEFDRGLLIGFKPASAGGRTGWFRVRARNMTAEFAEVLSTRDTDVRYERSRPT